MNQCRYCFENIKDAKLLYPCMCKAPVHKHCLILWNSSRKSNRNKCEICNCNYNTNLYFKICELELQIIIKILIIIAFVLLIIFDYIKD